jgi:hypothetical protein
MMQDVHVKLNTGCHGKAVFDKKKTLYQQIELKFKEESSKVLHFEPNFVWYSYLGTSVGSSEIPGKVLKCGAGEGWRRSVGPIV